MRSGIVVPDVATLLLHGSDPEDFGVDPVVAPERATVLLSSETLPDELGDAVRDAWLRMPGPKDHIVAGIELAGSPVEELLRPSGRPEHQHHEPHAHDHGERGGHDHHDMMAIVGEPSDDGLVMESVDFALGPLAPSLPGGLLVDLSLDGDVVAHAAVRATLHVDAQQVALGAAPDPLSPLAWRAAIDAALGPPTEAVARGHLVAVEIERALSHAAWLLSLARAIGWSALGDRARELARALLPVRAALDLDAATARTLDRAADKAARLVESRAARARLRGLAAVDSRAITEHNVGGPVARAAGVVNDVRADDELYWGLGFVPETRADGDAAARAELRVAEARAGLRIARSAATERGSDSPVGSGPDGQPVAVEGPRGPLHAIASADGSIAVAAPGAEHVRAIAGEAAVGLEFAAATTALVSFDISPWRIDP